MRDSSRASAYLHDEFFLELVENQRTLYKNNIFNSADNDIEIRERNFIKLKVLDELIASIQAVSDDKQIVDKKWKIF
jgi:conjugal transfer/entry exclusion protein